MYKKYEIPNASKDTVQKKIKCLRTAFRRELKKVKDAQKSGIGADEVEDVQSTLWYFKLLLFTAEQEESRESVSNIDPKMSDDTEDDVEVCYMIAIIRFFNQFKKYYYF